MLQETLGTLPRLRRPRTIAAEDDPVHLDFRTSCGQFEQRAPATNLDVVGVGANAEDGLNLIELKWNHGVGDALNSVVNVR